MTRDDLRRRVDRVVGRHSGEQVRAAMRSIRQGEPVADPILEDLARGLLADIAAIEELENHRLGSPQEPWTKA